MANGLTPALSNRCLRRQNWRAATPMGRRYLFLVQTRIEWKQWSFSIIRKRLMNPPVILFPTSSILVFQLSLLLVGTIANLALIRSLRRGVAFNAAATFLLLSWL